MRNHNRVKSMVFGMNGASTIKNAQTKKIIYEVEDLSKEIEDHNFLLRVCHEEALKDEEKGLHFDAYDLMDKALEC